MGRFENEYARLNKEQRQAVDAIDGPLLVIAGPGTGKTQLLTTRVANILLRSDAAPQNILCLTFTESAAYEMRERLIGLIGQQAYNLTISTYHAFGQELIRRFGDYFSDMPDLTAIDELGIYTIIQDIVANLPYSNALKKSDFYVRDIIGTISDFKRALFTPDDIRQVAKANQKFIDEASKLTRQDLAGIARISKSSIAAFASLCTHSKALTEDKFAIPAVLNLGQLWTEQLVDAVEAAHQSAKTTPLTVWKNTWLARDERGEFVAAGETTCRKLEALADIYEAYLSELARRKLYDYDDMILKAIDGLEHNTELRYSLQEQYMYILLDEFQDTNAAQLKLVRLLTDNPAYEGRPNVFAVGDDDQAIYAFQGADYSHMLAFQSLYRDVQTISLTRNYRSHKDVLHVAHGIAGQIESRLHHHVTGVDKVLRASREDLPPDSQVARHEFKSDVAQYAWVTKRIAELIKDGTPPSQIAVLAPQHRYLEPIIPYLRQLDIPVRYDKREDVLVDPQIAQLMTMAKLVLCLRAQDSATAGSLWPEILSYDFWELPTELIWKLSWQAADDRTEWTRLLLARAETKPIVIFLGRLANLANTETLETMLDYLIGSYELAAKGKDKAYRSPFYHFYFGSEAREDRLSAFWTLLSNLTVLRQHLRSYQPETGNQLFLSNLVDFARAHQEANIKVLNTSPYHEAAEAVQVMTAYKAKGMEFEQVFILACVDEVWGSRSNGQSSKIPLPANLNFVRYAGATDDERLRLLFVAITRAKLGLYLTSYQANFANRPTTRLQYLGEINDGDAVVSTLLPAKRQRVIREVTESPQIEELSAYWQARHTNPRTLTSLWDLLRPRLDRYQLSPTHLNTFTDLIYGGPERFLLGTILRFPSAPTVDGQYGSAIHETLQGIHFSQLDSGKLPALAEVLKSFEYNLAKCGLSQRDTKLLLDRGRRNLSLFYTKKRTSFKAADKHEVSFKQQGVFVGDAHLNGKIDKLRLDNKTRTATIIDYKTGNSHDKWLSTDPNLHKYEQQLYFYKLLVEGSYEYGDYQVAHARLEFVEPDSRGNIIDLPIHYDSATTRQLGQLIMAVWQHIMDLNFPDTSTYPQNLKGIRQFEQDLIDGNI